jgi:hypothetical protein
MYIFFIYTGIWMYMVYWFLCLVCCFGANISRLHPEGTTIYPGMQMWAVGIFEADRGSNGTIFKRPVCRNLECVCLCPVQYIYIYLNTCKCINIGIIDAYRLITYSAYT